MTRHSTVERALSTEGASTDAIYTAAAQVLRRHGTRGLLVDVGCGRGQFREFTRDLATDYIGVDVVRHKALAPDVTFFQADLDCDAVPVPSMCAAMVSALETIEHLENPRAFMRELVRVLKPGGALVVTTPNQLSTRSLLSLVIRGQFSEFHGRGYPAHLTALLPTDLLRMAVECSLDGIELQWTLQGRMPLTSMHYPRLLTRACPRLLSDHVVLAATKPA